MVPTMLWVRTFKTIEDLRAELVAFARRYNETWLVARHGYKTPARVREEQTMPPIAIDPTLAATAHARKKMRADRNTERPPSRLSDGLLHRHNRHRLATLGHPQRPGSHFRTGSLQGRAIPRSPDPTGAQESRTVGVQIFIEARRQKGRRRPKVGSAALRLVGGKPDPPAVADPQEGEAGVRIQTNLRAGL
jgi:hypothetical protein